MPDTLLRSVFERNVTLGPSDTEVTLDFVFTVEG
jgi:hypothetical protein